MDFLLFKKGLDFTKKNKKRVLFLSALGLTTYGACKLYNLPSVVQKRHRFFKLFGAFVSLAEMVSDSADTIGILSRDVKDFIRSDSDQVPQSLKQVSKIMRSNEFSESLSRLTRALTVGVLQGYGDQEAVKYGGFVDKRPGFVDRVIDKLFSDAGSGFASVVVGSLARNLVMALCSDSEDSLRRNKNVERWIEFACDEKCKELIADCIRLFVSTAVTVYLEKTMSINMYTEIFTGLTNPKHEARVKDLMVSVCNGGVDTFVRTSHQLWKANSVASSKLSCYDKLELEDGFDDHEKRSGFYKPKKLIDSNGWVGKVSSTLAVPSNRKLVVNMTGMVTFETVRCFLDFLLQKLSERMKRVDVVHEEVVDRGVEAMQYMSCKSSTVVSVCLTLCLQILNSPWVLTPAPAYWFKY